MDVYADLPVSTQTFSNIPELTEVYDMTSQVFRFHEKVQAGNEV